MEKTSSSSEFTWALLSHPDRTLEDHLNQCNKLSEAILSMKYIAPAFYPYDEIETWRKLLVYFHDFGKGTDYFQKLIIDAIRRESTDTFKQKHRDYVNHFIREKYQTIAQELRSNERLSYHAKLGAYFVHMVYQHENPIINCILLKVIRKHHGSLTNFAKNSQNGEEIYIDEDETRYLKQQFTRLNRELYEQIVQKRRFSINWETWYEQSIFYKSKIAIKKIQQQLEEEDTYQYFLLQHFLFSLLLSADKGDMMLAQDAARQKLVVTNTPFSTDTINNYKEIAFQNAELTGINKERENAYQAIARNSIQYADRYIFSITLPTGLGKTLAAYNAAILLQNKIREQTGTQPRIIYCLPFTSIIDQNAAILSEIFKENNLDINQIAKHHHLANYKSEYNENQLSYSESEYLTEGWEHDFIITTFVQFFESIFTNKNKALRKFHNICNAIVILDEVQNVPPKYYEPIKEVFEHMGAYFGTRFIFVTATQPIIFPRKEIIELTDVSRKKTKEYFVKRKRIQLNQSLLQQGKQDISYWINLFIRDIDAHSDKSFLFINNTIAQSQEVFNQLYDNYGEDVPIHYLSSSVLPVFRKNIIDDIRKKKGRQIVVSTQVVEAGVDIDLDIVYRDFAPMDSINQSAGRCNRNEAQGKGTVKLFDSGKAFIYDQTLRDITRQILSEYGEIIQEKGFYAINEAYFERVQSISSKNSNESIKLSRALKMLQLEDVADTFKLIDDKLDHLYYNVFICFDEEDLHKKGIDIDITKDKMPIAIQQKYLNIMTSDENIFEKKRALKMLRPQLMQYVTKFPKNKGYRPGNREEEDQIIIFEEDWRQYYDLKRGFITQNDQVLIF